MVVRTILNLIIFSMLSPCFLFFYVSNDFFSKIQEMQTELIYFNVIGDA
jgi:hypothetical protein